MENMKIENLSLINGNDLRLWREHWRFSQRNLADKIDYSVSRINHIERNNENLSKRLLKKIREIEQNELKQVRVEYPELFYKFKKLKEKIDKLTNNGSKHEKLTFTYEDFEEALKRVLNDLCDYPWEPKTFNEQLEKYTTCIEQGYDKYKHKKIKMPTISLNPDSNDEPFIIDLTKNDYDIW